MQLRAVHTYAELRVAALVKSLLVLSPAQRRSPQRMCELPFRPTCTLSVPVWLSTLVKLPYVGPGQIDATDALTINDQVSCKLQLRR